MMNDPWANALSGIVVRGVQDPYGAKSGGDFVWAYGPVYKIPDQWYEDQKHRSPEELAKLSKSQRNKLGEPFSTGTKLSFCAADDGTNIITHAQSLSDLLSGGGSGDTFLLDDVCVVSNEVPRRCYVEGLGFVPISEELAQSVLPNVVCSCRVAINVETNYYQPGITFETCTATANAYLHSLIDVKMTDFVWYAPWNRDRQRPRAREHADQQQDELEEYQLRREEERAPLKVIRNVPALMIGKNELYCSLANGRPVRMAMDLQKLPSVGHVRTIYAYWCPLNEAYIVYKSHESGEIEVRKRAGRAREIHTFKVRVKSVGIGGYYENEFLGYVYDKNYLLRFVPKGHIPDIDMWVRYWARNAHAKFMIDALAMDKEMDMHRLISDQAPFKGVGLVISAHGDVYIKELAQERCRLPSDFLNKFHVGQWIALRARPMPYGNGYGYWVMSAQPFAPRRLRMLETARMPNGKLALRATSLTKCPKNDFMFYSPLMGLVEADTSEFADFIRFIRPAEMPQAVDLWVVENENPQAQTRFKACSVKAPGPNVRVFASGTESLSDARAGHTENAGEQPEDAPLDQPLAQLSLHPPQRIPSDDIYVHRIGRLSRRVASQGQVPLNDNADTDRRH